MPRERRGEWTADTFESRQHSQRQHGEADMIETSARVQRIWRFDKFITLHGWLASCDHSTTRLTLDEWLAPLPPPEELFMHDPANVQVLLSRLLASPSLERFAALPRSSSLKTFGARRFIQRLRMFVRFGGPRKGAPNVITSDALNGERHQTHSWI